MPKIVSGFGTFQATLLLMPSKVCSLSFQAVKLLKACPDHRVQSLHKGHG
jgi:hypothetical protein